MSYLEACSLTLGEQELATVLETEPGQLRLRVKTLWENPVRGLTVQLRVPQVQPVAFADDQGIHGHLLTTMSGVSYFCHPRVRSRLAETMVQELAQRQGSARSEFVVSCRAQLQRQPNLELWYDDWYTRVRETLVNTLAQVGQFSRLTAPRLQSQLQRALDTLIYGAKGEPGGLPLTDTAQLLHDTYELEVAFPSLSEIGDEQLREELKLHLLAAIDAQTSILHTGKSNPGKRVMRVTGQEPRSHVTGTPVPRFALVANPLATHTLPMRGFREARALRHGLVFEHPTPPPLRTPGMRLPAELARRVTSLMVAVCDLPGWNVFPAGADAAEWGVAPGDQTCPDVLLLTRSGQRKLRALFTRSEVESEELFRSRLPERELLGGFRFQELIQQVGELSDRAPLFNYQYRWWTEEAHACGISKLKLLPGGIKAVPAPYLLPDLWATVGGKEVPVDLVVAETTVLSKGARDLVLYLTAALAGMTEIDPTVPTDLLRSQIQQELQNRGLDPSGLVPLGIQSTGYRSGRHLLTQEEAQEAQQGSGKARLERVRYRESLGMALAGEVPVMRAVETEERATNTHAGVKVNLWQGRALMGLPLQIRPTAERQLAELASFSYSYGQS